jgi:hypothetical protein
VHIPATDAEGKLELLGTDPADLFSTIVHNIEHAKRRGFSARSATTTSAHALPALARGGAAAGLDFVRRANALLASYDRDRHAMRRRGRVRVASACTTSRNRAIVNRMLRSGGPVTATGTAKRIRRKS